MHHACLICYINGDSLLRWPVNGLSIWPLNCTFSYFTSLEQHSGGVHDACPETLSTTECSPGLCTTNISQFSRKNWKIILHQSVKNRWSEWALRLNPQEVADPACWFLWKRRYFAVTFHSFCCLGYARIMRIWRTRLTKSIYPLIDRVWSIKGNRKSISKLS